eukprot:NODE_2322_length_1148_cov_10.748863_g1928_i0.p8 GENE.NODE_2322_length_1148_cov_10.748863_g1928_i0~~NODE_2322_length_1148_cov_10.748863_g1928_i0.p8  ORF type:complete len:54 (+),score=0.01 NODE_2322_length_1148_cov_10.748863_g1928_i0:940-1101(+)
MLQVSPDRTGQGPAAAKLLAPDLSQAERAYESCQDRPAACTRRPRMAEPGEAW